MKANIVKIGLTLLICLAVCPAEAQKKIKHKLYKTYWYEVDYNGIKEAWSKEKKVLIPQSLGCTKIVCGYPDDFFFVTTKEGYAGVFERKDGKSIIEPDSFVEIKRESDSKYNSYFIAKNVDGHVTLFTRKGRNMLPGSTYSRARLNSSDNGLIDVYQNDKEGRCDTLGNEIIPPKWKSLYGPCKNNYETDWSYDRHYVAKEDGNFYLLDSRGNVLYTDETKQYTGLGYWSYGGRSYLIVHKGNYEGILDMRGKTIIEPDTYKSISPSVKEGHFFFYVEKDGLRGACNAKGVEIVPTRYKYLFYSDGFKESIGGWYSTQYKDLGIKIDANFDLAEELKPEDAIVKVGDKYRLVDRNGATLTLRLYDALNYDVFEKLYYGTLNGYVTAISKDGKEQTPIGKQIFDEAYSLGDEYVQDQIELYFLLLKTDPSNLDGYNAFAYNNIGVIFRNAGDDNTALTCYEKALAIDPSNQTAKGNIKTIKAERRAERLNNIANALGQMSEALGNMNAAQGGGSYGAYQGSGSSSSGSSSNTRARRHCTNCAGTGNCPKCRGNGQILGKFDQEFRCCPICNYNCSASRDKKGKCTRCGGTGVK